MNALAGEKKLHETIAYMPSSPEFTYRSGDRPLEGYTIKRALGAGGFGEAYFAVSDGGKEVALKLIQRHLDIELRGVAQCLNLKHPNLVAIYDVRSTPKGESWIVMEYMAGDSLQTRLDRVRGPLGSEETLRWLGGVASAIDYLHDNGIVHRDLKPGNVFSEGDLVKIGDYGLSKFISTSRRSGQTQSIGTVHYMAPEISTGNYGRGVDIYAAGVIAYEMITGLVPFDGETTGEVLMKHLTAEPDYGPLPSQYRDLFRRALAKTPDERPTSVRELHDELARIASGEQPVGAKTVPTPILKAPPPKVASPPQPVAPPPLRQLSPPAKPERREAKLDRSIAPEPGTFAATRRGWSDLLWSMFVAGILSMIVSIVALAADVYLRGGKPDLRDYVALAVLTGIASWGLLAFARVWDQYRPGLAARRMNMLVFGMLLASFALGMDLWLGRELPDSGAIDQLRQGRVDAQIVEDLAPVALGYLGLGAMLFAIPDWAQTICRTRLHAFSAWSVIVASALGLFAGKILGAPDPFWLALVMGVITTVTQWASPHDPVKLASRLRGEGR